MKTRDYWFQQAAEDAFFDYYRTGALGGTIVALPTGTGKSHVIANICKRALKTSPGTRICIFTHVKELIKQNSEKLREAWPAAPMGIYSAGLRKKDTKQSIIYGGIASVKNNVEAFGHRDIVLIDECHLISTKDDATYNKVFAQMREINPQLIICGLTATYYRMGLGLLTEGKIFDKVVFDMTDVKGFTQLIAEGYIAPLIPRVTHTNLDVADVRQARGEFVQKDLEKAVNKDGTTRHALEELCQAGINRASWLVFATGVDHAETCARMLTDMGIPTAAIHSKINSKERDTRIERFKSGELRCLTNNNVLTTGFDHPPVDLIGMLRPTISASLWVQMAGRGTRIYRGKQNCMLLDFAGNTKRLGPINDPKIPGKKGKASGPPPVRTCEHCGTMCHISCRVCIFCGEPFPTVEKLTASSGGEDLLRDGIPEVDYFNVDRVLYHLHSKPGKPDMIRVTYHCGPNIFHEYVLIEHAGMPGRRAKDWWLQRWMGPRADGGAMPVINTAHALANTHMLATPKRLRVWTNKNYPEILGSEF